MSEYLCDECYEEPADTYHEKLGAVCRTCYRKVRMEGLKALDKHEPPQYDWNPWETTGTWGEGIQEAAW